MKKKNFARLLAFVMSAALVLQPVAVYATEQGEGDITDPVETVGELPSEEATIEQPELTTTVPEVVTSAVDNIDPETVDKPEIADTQETLPALQNVYIEGDNLYWDPIEAEPGQLVAYVVNTNGQGDYYAAPPVNLIDQCAYLNVSPGEVTVTLEAVDFNAGDEILSAITELKYVYQGGSNKTPLTSWNTTSDADQIFVLGAPATQVSVKLNNPDIIYEFNGWREKSGDDWNYIFPGVSFQDKSYKYDVTVKVSPLSSNTYCLDPDFELTVDGKKFTSIAIKKENSGEVSSIKFESPEYTFKPASEKTVIESANAISDYWTIPWVNEAIEQPGFLFSEDTPLSITGAWYKEESNGSWSAYYSGNFTPGNWRYQGLVRVEDGYEDSYEISPDFILLVCDFEWTRLTSSSGESALLFASENFTLEEPAERKLISEVTATSDISDIFVLNGELKSPKYSWDVESVSISNYWIQKEIDGRYTTINSSGEVTEGKYKVFAVVAMKDINSKEYALSEDAKLIVDGKEWALDRHMATINGYVMSAVYASPEIVVSGEEPPVIEEGKWITKYGAVYYEFPDGKKATGMQKIGTQTYLFSKNGTLQKNVFYESEGKKFYFGSEGKLVTGWFKKWSATYYADDDGVIQTGFTDIEDKTYYFKADGRMTVSTWITVGGDKYYSKADGHLAKSETILKWGKKYTFDDRGVLIN